MRKAWVIILFLSVLAVPVFSDGYQIDFVDGILEIMEDGSWIDVQAGDELAENAEIRVGDDSIVELIWGDQRLTVTTSGVYNISELTNQSSRQQQSQAGMWNTLRGSMKDLAQGNVIKETTVMGARAAEAGKEEFEWMDEDEEMLKQGQALLKEGAFKEAAALFEDALEYAAEEKVGEFSYYLGYTYSLLQREGPALKYLTQITPDPLDPFYEEWVIVTGELLVKNLSYDKALSVFEPYMDVYPEGRHIQPVLVLSGLSSGEMGDTVKQQKYLSQAVSLDPETEWGKLAQNILTN